MYQEHFSDYVLDLDNQILIHFFCIFITIVRSLPRNVSIRHIWLSIEASSMNENS